MFRRDPSLRGQRFSRVTLPQKERSLEDSGRGETRQGGTSSMQFKPGPIEGIIWRPLKKFHDARGWLCELFRHDDLPEQFHPVMCYISATEPGVARGPHEHVDQ